LIQEVDFHSHTVNSDGTLTSTELVELAKEKRIKALALTDHDTTSGLDEAIAAGKKQGVELIPGIEISAVYDPGTMHILGYFIDHHSKKLQSELIGLQEDRSERNLKIIEKLNSLGVKITLDEVIQESGGGQVGRPHFARVLVKKGYARDIQDAFNKYLAKGAQAYVDKRRISPQDGIRMVREAGGIAVLAHPKQLRAKTKEEFESVLDELVDSGLGGIEAYSSCQNEGEARQYREAGERRGIFITGGSDFHGANKRDVELGNMGSWAKLNYELVDAMRDYLKKIA